MNDLNANIEIRNSKYEAIRGINPKLEIRNPEQIEAKSEIRNKKHYDLEGRTLEFARQIRDYIKNLPRSASNQEYGKQLIRSASSIGANYIEANEALSKKDFVMRIKISRKEAKESIYWLNLAEPSSLNEGLRNNLVNEATELMKIFSAIMRKSLDKSENRISKRETIFKY